MLGPRVKSARRLYRGRGGMEASIVTGGRQKRPPLKRASRTKAQTKHAALA